MPEEACSRATGGVLADGGAGSGGSGSGADSRCGSIAALPHLRWLSLRLMICVQALYSLHRAQTGLVRRLRELQINFQSHDSG